MLRRLMRLLWAAFSLSEPVFGGIAAALRMRAKGFEVTLVDRLQAIGGRAQVFERGGFRHDAGRQ